MAGCKAVVPVTSNAAALSAIVHYSVDAAILHMNVSIAFLPSIAARPFLRKPHHPGRLIDTTANVIGMCMAAGGEKQNRA
jgi:hypothetical protein